MELPKAGSGDGTQARRRQIALYACASLAVLAVALQILGFMPAGWTIRVMVLGGLLGAATLIVAWAQHKLMQVSVLIVTSLFCVLIAEIALRSTVYRETEHDDLFQFDPHLGWRFIPEETGLVISDDYRQYVTVSKQGYRDFDHPDEASPEKPRPEQIVAVMGDSFTSNLGVDLKESFTTLLDEHLGPETSVRNFGVNGYGQVQELLLLDEILANVRPDLVLLVIFARNDLDDNTGRFDWVRGYKRPTAELNDAGQIEIVHGFGPSSEDPPLSFYGWVRTTALDRLFRTAMGSVEPKLADPNWITPEFRYARVPLAAEERQALATVSALLGEFDRRTKAAGSQFGVVVAPGLIRIDDEQWQIVVDRYAAPGESLDVNQLHALLAEDSARGGRAHFDLVEALQAKASEGTELYFASEEHWNRAGNAVVAEALAAWLRQSDLLGTDNTQ